MCKVAIVTGGTSGIGRATALALQSDGWTVYELSRRGEGMADVRHIVADITKEETLSAAVAQVMAEEGRIDLVINNAGFGLTGCTKTNKEGSVYYLNFKPEADAAWQAQPSISAISSSLTDGSAPLIIAVMRSAFSPRQRPASIGPPEQNTVGMFSRIAAISMPGVTLSQFDMHIIASSWR